MIVITLTDCPPALRGDLTKWLQEINTGVYVGQVNARVKDELWKRVTENAKSGRATMVFSAQNEQRLDFRVHNTLWEPINFDGLKLMLRPSPSRIKNLEEKRSGYSNAAKMRMAKKMARKNQKIPKQYPENYVVVDVETTGLSAAEHEMIEAGAIKVKGNEIASHYGSLVKINGQIPKEIEALTGINDKMISQDGKDLEAVMKAFLEFVGDSTVVTHNGEFDYKFLRAACKQLGVTPFSNKCIDTMKLARRSVEDVKNYKLETLLDYFNIEVVNKHRSLDDCITTHQLYQKLINFEVEEKQESLNFKMR